MLCISGSCAGHSMMNAAIPQICVDPATLTPLICQGDHGSVSPDTATHCAVMYRILNATTCLSIMSSCIHHTPLLLVGVHAAAFMKHCHPLSAHQIVNPPIYIKCLCSLISVILLIHIDCFCASDSIWRCVL